MAWVILCAAGLLEVGWATALPATNGLTRPVPTIAFLVLLGASMFGLAKATETIPIGTGYAVWVGIGAVGTAALSHFRGDRLTLPRVLCLALIVAGVIGLNLTGGHGAETAGRQP